MLWEHEPQASVSTAFGVLPNFPECLYNLIETRSTCFFISFRKQRGEKKKNNLLTLIIKM